MLFFLASGFYLNDVRLTQDKIHASNKKNMSFMTLSHFVNFSFRHLQTTVTIKIV